MTTQDFWPSQWSLLVSGSLGVSIFSNAVSSQCLYTRMTCIHAKPKPAKKRSSERVVIMRIRLHYYCTRVCCLFTIIASNRSKQPHLRFWLLPLLLSILWRLKGGEKLKNEDLSALRKCSLILRSMALQSVARKRNRASQCACTASLSPKRRRTFEVHNPT